MSRWTVVEDVDILYSAECVVIKDCYKVKDKDMLNILVKFIIDTGYKSKRSIASWEREWKAHKRMYKLGIARSHTRDCDLEEDIKPWLRVIYWLIGVL